MSSTIENINASILGKLSIIRSIIIILNKFDIDRKDIDCLKVNYVYLDKLKTDYTIGTVNHLIDYYGSKSDKLKNKYYKVYTKYLMRHNIMGNVNRVYRNITAVSKQYNFTDNKLLDLLSEFTYLHVKISSVRSNDIKCVCGEVLNIEPKNSEFYCKKCGECVKLYGTVFEDDQFWLQEGHRTKHGKYDPTKHCKFWIDRIQAKENTNIPKAVLNKIKKCILRDRIWIDQLDCKMIRGYLKNNKLSSYNDHVPLIRKLISGNEPEQLSDKELSTTYLYFSRIIQMYNKNKPVDKPNCPYHPFFIYKILENIIKDKGRQDNILSCIHLQSRETLIENDRIWKGICEKIDGFVYMPTESN